MSKLFACAVALALVAPVSAAPRIFVADFDQMGYRGPAADHVADLLARALSETRRFEVERIADTPQALAQARAKASGPAWLVEGGIRAVRPVGNNSVFTGMGYGSGRGVYGLSRRVGTGTPGNLIRGSSWSLDGWVRVHDANDGRLIGQKNFSGWTVGLHPNYWYNGGVYGQALDAAVLDEKTGAARLVMDMLPLEGTIVSASERGAVVDVGSSRAVAQGERFVVLPPSGGEPVAILRARHAVSPTRIDASVSYPERGGRAPRPGDLVLSRGY